MHDLLLAVAFIGMLLSPAIVAAFSGTSETNPEYSPPATPFHLRDPGILASRSDWHRGLIAGPPSFPRHHPRPIPLSIHLIPGRHRCAHARSRPIPAAALRQDTR